MENDSEEEKGPENEKRKRNETKAGPAETRALGPGQEDKTRSEPDRTATTSEWKRGTTRRTSRGPDAWSRSGKGESRPRPKGHQQPEQHGLLLRQPGYKEKAHHEEGLPCEKSPLLTAVVTGLPDEGKDGGSGKYHGKEKTQHTLVGEASKSMYGNDLHRIRVTRLSEP